jgi:hypothetical protein
MAEPFGIQDQGGPGKRPAPTIEGTATEVSVEPALDDAPEAGSDGDAAPHPAAGQSETEKAEAKQSFRPRLAALKSFMTHLAAGLVGGIIGVGALALAWSNLDFGSGDAPSPEIANLEQRIAQLEAAPAPSVDSEKVAQLESRIAALEVNTNETPAEMADLHNRVVQLESTLKAMAETASEGGSIGSAAAISQQIAEAEQKLNEKIAAARAEGEQLSGTVTGLQNEIAALGSKLSALAEAELGGGATDAGPELNALSERIAKIESVLPELIGAIGKETADVKSAAAAIAFANLRAAVSEGRPYAAELDTLGALAPGIGDLGVLPAYAEKGIPTLPELTRSFAAAREDALAAVTAPPSDSFFDNLLASAQSLVTIKRIDEEPAGEGPSAAPAKAKAALDKGDLADAIKQVETLEDAPRQAFSAWLGAAHARLGADAIMTRLEGLLLLSMSGDSSQQP